MDRGVLPPRGGDWLPTVANPKVLLEPDGLLGQQSRSLASVEIGDLKTSLWAEALLPYGTQENSGYWRPLDASFRNNWLFLSEEGKNPRTPRDALLWPHRNQLHGGLGVTA